MQCDDIAWQIIDRGHCSYRVTSKTQKFCRNEYSLTGLCNRTSCPITNSQYATVREENGVCYLYMKVIERSHYPRRLWEKVKLNRNMTMAVEQISDNLAYWNEFIRQKCKARLVRIHQYLSRMRRIRAQGREKKLITVARKVDRREKRREDPAERQYVEDFAESDEDDEDMEDFGGYTNADGQWSPDATDESDDDNEDEAEADQPSTSTKRSAKKPSKAGPPAKKKFALRRPHIEIEYEEEDEQPRQKHKQRQRAA